MIVQGITETASQVKASVALKGDGETILVVEDEEMLRDFLQTVLSESGYKVILAANGTESVRKFAQHKDEVDLVLLDLGLPGQRGEEVLSMLIALKPDVKVIAASGSINEEALASVRQMGATDCLSKPYLIEDLLLKLRAVLH